MSDPDYLSDDYSNSSVDFYANSSSMSPPSDILFPIDSNSDSEMSSPEVIEELPNNTSNIAEIQIIRNVDVYSPIVRTNLRLRRRQIRDIEILDDNTDDDAPNGAYISDTESGSYEDSANNTDAEFTPNESESEEEEQRNAADLVNEAEDVIEINSPIDINVESDSDFSGIGAENEVELYNDADIQDVEVRLTSEPNVIPESNISYGNTNLPQISTVASSSGDFHKSPILSKKRKRNTILDDSTDDSQTCSICFEPWCNSGEHRIASLKCGHLFGKNCIERWLQGSASRCPQCNLNSSKRDIRILYAKSIRALDTIENDRLTEELTKVKSEKTSLERKHARVVMNNEKNSQLVSKLQEEMRMLKESLKKNSDHVNNIAATVKKELTLILYKCFDLSSGCRVMCYNEWLNMLVVSVTTNSGMFPGCGVKKINLYNMRIDKYIPIHRKQIKDLAFNPSYHEILLSVGLDELIKITNVSSNATVHQYKMSSQVFSCCWKAQSSTEFYIGTSQGKVLHFNTSVEDAVDIITVDGSGPVITLLYVSQMDGFYAEGLIVVRLDSICFLNFDENKKKLHRLEIEGPFTGINFDPVSKHYLINCRPSQRHPHARHILCSIVTRVVDAGMVIVWREVYTFMGSSTMKMLSRSSIVATALNRTLVVINEESSLCAKIYDGSSFQLVQKIYFSAAVLECLVVSLVNDYYIIFLTEKKTYLYKLLERQ